MTTGASNINGICGPAVYNNDVAESSKMAAEIDPVFHAVNLARGIFNVGYLNQEWSDIQLTFFASGLKSHRLILARSPYLAHLMSAAAPGTTIHLSFTDGNVTEESVHIVLQHLYNPSMNLVYPQNARAVLATAFLFGGMPELIHHAYLVIRDSLDAKNVVDLVYWLEASSDSSAVYDGQTPSRNHREDSVKAWLGDPYPRYGEWTIRLRHDAVNYLLHSLPEQVIKENKFNALDDPLSITYAHLPYELFKALVESPELPIVSHQDRFTFVKKVLVQRKKIAPSGGPQMEENVVLAFRGGEGMEVHVTRRPKKGRTFFKVEG
ncbi:hypothetical protein C359_00192 [Cryptococcus neoformans Bt120]|nr:hypothetical protein C359_00192 [Cryptococcus neoformans var. grubii Bt120]